MTRINLLTRLKGMVSTDANKLLKVSTTGNALAFGGLFDTPATINLVAGYNNDVVFTANANNYLVSGVFGQPAILTGISRAGNYNGEVITLRNNGATFLIAMFHLRESSALANSIMASGASTTDTLINYVPVTRGQQAILYWSTAVNRWILTNATQLMYSIPMKKGVSYIQQACGSTANLGYLSSASSGTGATIQGNSTPSVGQNQSLSLITTGTTATGRVSQMIGGGTSNLTQYALGNNYIETQFQFSIEFLSTATERFSLRFGLLNNHTAPTSGIWAEYRDDENTARWTLKCNNGTTATVINSTTTVTGGTTQLLSLIWNGVDAKLISGNTILATIPTGSNFPTTQGVAPMLTIEKLIGTTARRIYFMMTGLIRLETTL